MALLDEVKLMLRISHDRLDSEISDLIAAAKNDMERAGVSAVLVTAATDSLVKLAIKTFVMSKMMDSKEKAEGFQESYAYQLDNLRKSAEYNTDPEPDPDPDPDPGEDPGEDEPGGEG